MSDTTKHTPGPWRTHGDNWIEVDDNLVIARVENLNDHDRVRANQRLIAAAPDLLAALQKAVDESGCDGELCMHARHDAARQAIAKATGAASPTTESDPEGSDR
jgi:hypothetical protein